MVRYENIEIWSFFIQITREMRKKMPKSLRKFIRREKARIRRQVLDTAKQEEMIQEIYRKFNKNEDK